MAGADRRQTDPATSPDYVPELYWGSLHASGRDLRVVGYPTLPLAFNRALYANTAAAVRRAIRRADVTARGRSVLDIGSGIGFWIDFWRAEGAREIAGADLVPEAVDRLRELFPESEFVQADIGEGAAPFTGRRFDLISAMGVLLHIVDEERFRLALAAIDEQLADDGVVVLAEPLAVRRHDRSGREASHNVARSLADWESALAGTRLRIAQITPVTYLLSDPVDAATGPGLALRSLWWRGFAHLIRGRETLASAVMPPLAAVDRALASVAPTGPSSKCVILRRA